MEYIFSGLFFLDMIIFLCQNNFSWTEIKKDKIALFYAFQGFSPIIGNIFHIEKLYVLFQTTRLYNLLRIPSLFKKQNAENTEVKIAEEARDRSMNLILNTQLYFMTFVVILKYVAMETEGFCENKYLSEYQCPAPLLMIKYYSVNKKRNKL